eukprot:6186846-Pleurochrysis_carterae.AAC.6
MRVEFRILSGARTSPALSAVSMSCNSCISSSSATPERGAPPVRSSACISPTACRASAYDERSPRHQRSTD